MFWNCYGCFTQTFWGSSQDSKPDSSSVIASRDCQVRSEFIGSVNICGLPVAGVYILKDSRDMQHADAQTRVIAERGQSASKCLWLAKEGDLPFVLLLVVVVKHVTLQWHISIP